ncbi:MAG: methionyl-tRNA formyltransferase [Deltaproteobacteria bacterium]|nr:methionyl-tRNA formyltransferase [Deltaproteobacteria bacterium]
MKTNSSQPYRVIFLGTPDFARVILQGLIDSSSFNVLGVVAQPDKPVGRGRKMQAPPVALLAKEHNLPLFQPSKLRGNQEVVSALQEMNPDFLVVAAYGKILADDVLRLPKIDCINVHASLLPAYRGAAPINYAILKGENETGVSIMRVDKELDAGAVFLKKAMPILDEDNAESLTKKMALLGRDALLEALPMIAAEELKGQEQNHEQATYAPKLSKEMGLIDWAHPAETIFNQVRALDPWPTAVTELQKQTLKVFKTQVLSNKSQQKPGTVVHVAQQGWTVATGSKDLLLQEIQLAGKKRMSAFDLANGMRLKAPFDLGEQS